MSQNKKIKIQEPAFPGSLPKEEFDKAITSLKTTQKKTDGLNPWLSQQVLSYLANKMTMDQITSTLGTTSSFLNKVVKGEAGLKEKHIQKLLEKEPNLFMKLVTKFLEEDVKEGIEISKEKIEDSYETACDLINQGSAQLDAINMLLKSVASRAGKKGSETREKLEALAGEVKDKTMKKLNIAARKLCSLFNNKT